MIIHRHSRPSTARRAGAQDKLPSAGGNPSPKLSVPETFVAKPSGPVMGSRLRGNDGPGFQAL